MDHFTAHLVQVEVEVVTPLALNPHKGSSLRGAIFHALLNRFCMNRHAQLCAECPLAAGCPVAFLVSTMRPESERGRDVPRPYAIRPPLDRSTRYEPGDRFSFGLTLFAQALNLFPYIVLVLDEMGRAGLGLRLPENRQRRGTFRIQAVTAVNPLTGECQPILQAGEHMVQLPDIPITHPQIIQRAGAFHATQLTIRFLTPTRIVDQDNLVKRPLFRPLFQRLLERLSALAREFSDTPLQADFPSLIGQAEQVQLVRDHTHWVELESYSTRLGRATPLGGFIGTAVYEAPDWQPFLPWLIWGQFTHVGKDAVKGNGWYQLGSPKHKPGPNSSTAQKVGPAWTSHT
jgi:hypothetical protein